MGKVSYDYPYRLHVEHGESAELRLSRRGRSILVDPLGPPGDDDIVLITGPGADRVRGVAEAVRAGRAPEVVAPEGVLAWLEGQGRVRRGAEVIDGVRFEGLPYEPPAPGRRVGLRPLSAIRALRTRGPDGPPSAWQLTFPDGARMVLLDVALHAGTPEAWVDRAVERFGGAEWVICGVPFGEGAAVERLVGRFAATRVLLADLVNSERRAQGLPVELVTPVRDRVMAQGVEAHVFATQTSYRFE